MITIEIEKIVIIVGGERYNEKGCICSDKTK